MTEFNLNNSSLRVCVDRVNGCAAAGRVFGRRLTAPILFDDLSSLALRLDQVFDQQNFPQAFQSHRTFLREKDWEESAVADLSDGMSEEMVNAQYGAIATFEILMVSRRNSSWQGMIDWLDGRERRNFYGYLELLRLLSERLTDGQV
ncbi:MAG: hypothetical protein IKM11_00680 [Oscillospiraceae bacterium]|nr:hypothetical protein [Oscillospiraceae bacterium]